MCQSEMSSSNRSPSNTCSSNSSSCKTHNTHSCGNTSEKQKIVFNSIIKKPLTTKVSNIAISQIISEFLKLMEERNGSDMKISVPLIVATKLLFHMINKIPKVKKLLIKMCDEDGHQDYEKGCFCVYHDGDSLIMHLFMCALTIGASMVKNGNRISEKYGESKLSLIVVNMFIGITHDIGKYFCTYKDLPKQFLGFPFHGQGSALFLLIVFDKDIRTSLGLTEIETYKTCLVSNYHMDWYHSKSGTANYEQIMALARFFGKDVLDSLYYLCIADNLAKITKEGISDRKFPTYQSLLTHALEFKKTISIPISMSEMKKNIKVEEKGIMVFVINASGEGSILIPDSLTLRKDIKVFNDVSELKTVEKYLKEGKTVIINSSITLKKEFADYIIFGDKYLKVQLIYSDIIVKDTFDPLPQITKQQSVKEMRTRKELCCLYAKPNRDTNIKSIQPHVSLPITNTTMSLNCAFNIFGITM